MPDHTLSFRDSRCAPHMFRHSEQEVGGHSEAFSSLRAKRLGGRTAALRDTLISQVAAAPL